MDLLFIVFPLLAAITGAALWGWGWLAGRCARRSELPVVATVALGLAVVIGIGGALNLARIAFATTLDGVVITGLALAGLGFWRTGRPAMRRPACSTVAAALPLLVAAGFLVAYLVPPAAYNHNDDFEKYFVHPVKMLALGTLPPNFGGSLGGETLGAQALLQAFVVAHWPVAYLGVVDAVFCLLLCAALAAFAFPATRWALVAIIAELCVFAINPQIVNSSALYSGTALMMTAIYLVAQPGAAGLKHQPSAPLLGLVYAGLLALKVSFAPFVALHLLAVLGFGPFAGHSRWSWMLRVGAWTLLFVAPWVLLHAPLYLASPRPPIALLSARDHLVVHPFSPARLGYGASQLHYTLLALVGAGSAAWFCAARWRGWIPRSWPAASLASAGLSAAVFYLTFAIILAPSLFADPSGIRYACPLFLASIPLGLRLLATPEVAGGRRFGPIMAAGLGLAIVLIFLPSARDRVAQWRCDRVPLAYFSKGDPSSRLQYIDYTQEVLNGGTRARLLHLQSLVPAGEPLGAWVMTPFWFDFRRNPITHLDPAGLAARWANMPNSVRYFLFQHHGFAVRSNGDFIAMAMASGIGDRIIGARALDFLDDLTGRAARAQVLYADDEYVLFSWREPWARANQPKA